MTVLKNGSQASFSSKISKRASHLRFPIKLCPNENLLDCPFIPRSLFRQGMSHSTLLGVNLGLILRTFSLAQNKGMCDELIIESLTGLWICQGLFVQS